MGGEISPKYKYIIDSFAWREYFKGTSSATEFKSIIEFGAIEGRNITPTIVLAELKRIYMRDGLDFDEDLKIIKEMSMIMNTIDEETALFAGELRQKLAGVIRSRRKNIGLIDCLLLALALKYNAKVLTGDEHFKKIQYPERYKIEDKIGNLKNFVEYIGS